MQDADPFDLEPASPPPAITPPTAATLTDNRPCLNCGYSLLGLRTDGRCPECGVLVERSLRGNLLAYSSIDYLRSLRLGITLIVVSIVARAAITVVALVSGVVVVSRGTPTPISFSQTGATLLGIAAGFVGIMGWWLFSTPDPDLLGGETGSRARQIVRVTVIIAGASQIVTVATDLIGPLTSAAAAFAPVVIGLTLIATVASLVHFFAAMNYLRWIAPRIPDIHLHTVALRYMWLLPVIFVVGMCVIIGPLIAGVMYFLLLLRVRTGIANVIGSHQDTVHPADDPD